MNAKAVAAFFFHYMVLIESLESFQYQLMEDCSPTQFFSTTTFQCTECSKFQVKSHDGKFKLFFLAHSTVCLQKNDAVLKFQ